MEVFDLRRRLVEDYASYIGSFIRIRDARLQAYVQESLGRIAREWRKRLF